MSSFGVAALDPRFAALDPSFAALDPSFAALNPSFAALDPSFAALDPGQVGTSVAERKRGQVSRGQGLRSVDEAPRVRTSSAELCWGKRLW